MRTTTAFCAAAAAAALAGCYSMNVASSPTIAQCRLASESGAIAEHVLLKNDGWFLFGCVPIVCGNPDPAGWLPWAFFSNRTDMDHVQRPLMGRAKATGTRIVQMSAVNADSTLLSIYGLQGISLPVPYLICHRETQISALLVRERKEVP